MSIIKEYDCFILQANKTVEGVKREILKLLQCFRSESQCLAKIGQVVCLWFEVLRTCKSE